MRGSPHAVLAVGVVVGAAVGLGIAASQPMRYRAETSVVVAPALKRADPALQTLTHTVASLARSNTVAENVITSLQLRESVGSLRSDIRAHARPGTALVEITADQGNRVEAERVLQQAVVVLQQLVAGRLPHAVPGELVVWDAPGGTAHAVGRPFVAWTVGGASLGLVLAGAVLLVPRRRRRSASAEPSANEVSDTLEASDAEPDPPQRQPQTEPEPEPERTGLIAELRRRAAAEPDPRRQAEMHVYVDQLAPFAAPDGSLPSNLIGLAEEVFGPVA